MVHDVFQNIVNDPSDLKENLDDETTSLKQTLRLQYQGEP